MTDDVRKLSIITPCYNEEGNVAACSRALADVMATHLAGYDYEHIFADNASTDGTVGVLRGIAGQDPRVKVIVNSRNVGPFRNMANAMCSATGQAVVPMLPADLQDPPSVIPQFVTAWEKGALVVYGIRTNRREGVLLRAARGLFYRIISLSGGAGMAPPHAGEFQLLDRRVVESITSLGDEYPYVRGLVAQTGVRSSSVEYTWASRTNGKSKNNFWSLLDQAANAFVTTARAPARLALILGLAASAFGILFGIGSLVALALSRGTVEPGVPTLIVGVFVFGGLQLFFIGLIGEYVLSIHSQVRPGPAMFEVERINLDG